MIGFTTVQFIWVAAPLFVSGVALFALFRTLRTPMNADHHAFIQSMIRIELAKMIAEEKHDKLLNDIQKKVFPGDLFSE